MTDRRTFTIAAGVFAGALLTMLGGPAHAQDTYPSRPITLLVPFPPGGSADVVIRPVAAKVADALKQPIVIDNRSGGGGNIAAQATKQATACQKTKQACTDQAHSEALCHRGHHGWFCRLCRCSSCRATGDR